MLTTCDSHQDFLVVYDTPILRECPVCRVENDIIIFLEQENETLEQANNSLNDETHELELEIRGKEQIIKRWEEKIDSLENELEELKEEANSLRQINDEYYKKKG